MGGNGEIELNPAVTVNGTDPGMEGASQIPLCVRYHLPVFESNIWQKVWEDRRMERDTMEEIRQEVFAVNSQGEDVMLRQIYMKVFQTAQIQTVGTVKKDEETEILSDTKMSAGYLVITGVLLFWGLRYIRKIKGARSF